MADLALITSPGVVCRTQRVVLPGGERTWTVVDREHRVVEAAEQYLEYLRMLGRSPNTGAPGVIAGDSGTLTGSSFGA